jgi:hypothetical protein
MPAKFDDGGIRFLFPENWRLEREDSGEGWAVTVQSPETAFFLLSVNAELPSTEEVLAAALSALQAEYKELEYEDCVDTIAGQPAVGQDIRFISLDLTNTCLTRSFYTVAGTVLVLCQWNDLESEVHEPVLRAICASLQADD